MRIDIIMPQLGESVVEGTITRWLVKPGDMVQRDQTVVEVATDKADSEVPSPEAGRVMELRVAEGATTKIGAVLCVLETDAAAETVAPIAPPALPAPSSVAEPTHAPAPLAVPSGPHNTATWSPQVRPSRRSPPRSAFPGLATSPAVRRVALEHGIDLAQVAGTGERGRVTVDDVLRKASMDPDELRKPGPLVGDPPPAAMPAPPAPKPVPSSAAKEVAAMMNGPADVAVPGVGYRAYRVPVYIPKDNDRVVSFTRRRRLTADHMVYSKTVSPHVVTVAEIDLVRTMRLRSQHAEAFKADGVSLTVLSFVCAAVAKALREHPEVNARVLDDSYVVLGDINLGVAIDTPEGLVAPHIKRADELSIRGMARALGELAAKARAGKITADDLLGATFTVSNPGAKGNLFGAAVISQPNVGILRIGEIKKRVVVVESDAGDAMVIHPVMFAALSYDHRIIDGVLANAFLWRISEILSKGEFAL